MSSPAPASRPRTVAVAFWCWVVAAVITAALGMFLATVNVNVTIPFRVAGAILAIVGLAQGYLAGRARSGQRRFASAGVGLAMAAVAYLVVLLILQVIVNQGVFLVAFIMVLLITGSAFSQRPASQQWFESHGAE